MNMGEGTGICHLKKVRLTYAYALCFKTSSEPHCCAPVLPHSEDDPTFLHLGVDEHQRAIEASVSIEFSDGDGTYYIRPIA